MTRLYFGTDGIRGKVGIAPIVPDFMLRLGFAAGKVFTYGNTKKNNKCSTVLIGKDTRISGYMIEAALEAGFSAAGVNVMLAGPMPTSGIAYLTRTLRLTAGVVISASHNPYYDNGVKFFSSNGNKLADITELQIEENLNTSLENVSYNLLGKAKRIDDAAGRYIEFCKSTFPQKFSLNKLKIVIDCAHGAAYHVAPYIFHELGAEVVAIGVKPNGFNINNNVGVNSLGNLIRAIRTHCADIGIAFDGDADRVKVVDMNGRIYNGDELLYILVRDRIITNGKVEGVVGTLMTNMAIEIAIKNLGVKFIRANVGDRYILKLLQENGWQLGAEVSGHILSLDYHSTGDGIISSLLVLAAMKRSGCSLSEMLDGITLFPQRLINIKVPFGINWKDNKAIHKSVENINKEIYNKGRILIRASGTESILRIMVEAKDNNDVIRFSKELIKLFKKLI